MRGGTSCITWMVCLTRRSKFQIISWTEKKLTLCYGHFTWTQWQNLKTLTWLFQVANNFSPRCLWPQTTEHSFNAHIKLFVGKLQYFVNVALVPFRFRPKLRSSATKINCLHPRSLSCTLTEKGTSEQFYNKIFTELNINQLNFAYFSIDLQFSYFYVYDSPTMFFFNSPT